MQNNVTELTQRLLRSLDSNYNVIDMPAVIDIISLLEKVAITKELLETTRLGKHINELRRKTTNDSLSKRAKGLLKKWRSMVLPDSNGQIKTSPPLQQAQQQQTTLTNKSRISPPLTVRTKASPPLVKPSKISPPLAVPQQFKTKTSPLKLSPPLPGQKLLSPGLPEHSDVNLNQVKTKKRPAKEQLDNVNAKRARLNGGVTDLEFSDNSNSSFKDVVIPSNLAFRQEVTLRTDSALRTEAGLHRSETVPNKAEVVRRDVIMVNSDSNSSFPENSRVEPLLEQQMPKKRGRKKGSKNHKALIDDAESSFTNKLAVSASRGNSKVKTTQELLASIQNKNSVINVKPKEDLIEKAAKLTERVQVIDQKLNTNANRNKNSQKGKLVLNQRNDRVIESGSVINDKSLLANTAEDEIVVVDDIEPEIKEEDEESHETDVKNEPDAPSIGAKSLSIEEALALLPPVDKSVLYEAEAEEIPRCTCFLKENKSDFSIIDEDDDEDEVTAPKFEFIEDGDCPAKDYLTKKYRLDRVDDAAVRRLHETFVHSVNGIYSLGAEKPEPERLENCLYANVVPNFYEKLEKNVKFFDTEDYKRYRVSNHHDDVVDNSDERSDIVIKRESDEERTEDNSEKSDGNSDERSVFREWFECAEKPSYGGEVLKILPYTIID